MFFLSISTNENRFSKIRKNHIKISFFVSGLYKFVLGLKRLILGPLTFSFKNPRVVQLKKYFEI